MRFADETDFSYRTVTIALVSSTACRRPAARASSLRPDGENDLSARVSRLAQCVHPPDIGQVRLLRDLDGQRAGGDQVGDPRELL
jgi:hypothetical protein